MSRLAVITGGTRGIGAAICKEFKKNGYDVAAIYAYEEESAVKFAEDNDLSIYKCDVSNIENCKQAILDITKDFGKAPEILVNNAGIIKDCVLHKMDDEVWHEVIKVNLDSCYNMCRSVINHMRDNKFGRIISISSINALAGQFGQTNYSASKAGILGLTKALALESAAKGITVNAIAPGYIKTDMTDAVDKSIMENLVAQIPVGRLGKPIEIAKAALFLASDDSGFITGETLSVNGGQYNN